MLAGVGVGWGRTFFLTEPSSGISYLILLMGEGVDEEWGGVSYLPGQGAWVGVGGGRTSSVPYLYGQEKRGGAG